MIKEMVGVNKRFLRWTCDGNWKTTENYIDYDIVVENDTLFLKFQQSHGLKDINGISDWIRNIRAMIRYCRMLKTFVHKGFSLGFEDSFDEVISDIYEKLYENKNIKKIQVSGYSQGSAIALLYTYFLRRFPWFKNQVTIEAPYAFATPRVFWCLFFWVVKKWIGDAILIIAYGDPVSHAPFAWMGYKHVGKKVMVGNPKEPIDAKNHHAEIFETFLPD